MSYGPDDFAPEVEIRSELPPFAVAPHWITFSASGNATKLYNLYAAHGSGDSLSDRVVWPTLDDLAEMMKLSRGDKVTPYMRELERLGAIEVEKVRTRDRLRWRYRITVKVMPPADYDGPLSTGDWYARNRPEYAERHHKSSVSAGQAQHPEKGVLQGHENRGLQVPFSGGLQVPREGDRSTTTGKKNNHNKNDAAPSARSAADAGGSTSGSRGSRASGSAATSGARAPKSTGSRTGRRQRMSRKQAEAVRAVEASWPEALARLLPQYRPPVLRDAILEALDARTPEQLARRISYRWHAYNYAHDALSAEGRGIQSAVGVAVALVQPGKCADPMCEDGTIFDTGEICRACEQRAADRGGPSLPRQAGKAREPLWECAIPSCRKPSPGTPPEDGLCPACRLELEAATERLQAARA